MPRRNRTLTGLTPEQERVFRERQLERIARSMARDVAGDIYKAMREIGAANGSPGYQAAAVDRHSKELTRVFAKYYATIWDKFGAREVRGAEKTAGHSIERKDAMPPTEQYDAMRAQWIAQYAALRVTPIVQTTEKQSKRIILDAVLSAIDEGLSERETARRIAKNIRQQGGVISGTRAQTIARTEAHAAGQESHP